MSYKRLRYNMVKTQLERRGISDRRVLEALKKVPRHYFVPKEIRSSAYDDSALPIGAGQIISPPYVVAKMTENLHLKGDEKVLEVGTGSGYQAAILAELCEKVYSIERIDYLSKNAEKRVKELGYIKIYFIIGDGTLGYAEAASYDGIIVTAGSPTIPLPLIKQLKNNGRLIIPIKDINQEILITLIKCGNKITIEESIPCDFLPLIGKEGWPSSPVLSTKILKVLNKII